MVIFLILGITVLLILKMPKAANSSGHKEVASVGLSPRDEWLGIFLQGKRVGYSFTKISKGDSGLTVENHSQMTLIIMNETRTLMTHLYSHADEDYALKDFSLDLLTAGHQTRVQGKVIGTQLTLTTFSQGKTNTQTMTLSEKPYFPDAIEEVIRKKALKTGDEIRVPYFDPTTQSSATAQIKVFDKEKVMVFDEEFIGRKFEIDYMGITSILWLDDDYRLIKEYSPAMGMEMIPLSKEEALTEIEPEEAFDLLPYFAVKLDEPISNIRGLSYLKLQLAGITIVGLDLSDDFQNLASTKPIIIECRQANIDELPELSLPIKAEEEFLKPSVYIQCQDSDIIAKAKEIVGGENDAKKAVGRLVSGVYNFIEKKPTASLPSAIDVLKTREGDCNEHAGLFTALARALGIPTKIYVGLVNIQGSAYYYHAWCGVWLGKWVSVDPTFDQYPADLGHLKLKEGEISEQAKVLKVVGKLKIDVLSLQYKDEVEK